MYAIPAAARAKLQLAHRGVLLHPAVAEVLPNRVGRAGLELHAAGDVGEHPDAARDLDRPGRSRQRYTARVTPAGATDPRDDAAPRALDDALRQQPHEEPRARADEHRCMHARVPDPRAPDPRVSAHDRREQRGVEHAERDGAERREPDREGHLAKRHHGEPLVVGVIRDLYARSGAAVL
jgi:hypothetical protein